MFKANAVAGHKKIVNPWCRECMLKEYSENVVDLPQLVKYAWTCVN